MENILPQKFVKTYQKSQVIFSEASVGKEMYIIYSGKIKLHTKQASGHRKLLASLGEGDFFGEMALVDDSPRSATAIADEDNTQLVVLDQNKFMYLLRNQPDFALVVMEKLCKMLRVANNALNADKAKYDTTKRRRKKPA